MRYKWVGERNAAADGTTSSRRSSFFYTEDAEGTERKKTRRRTGVPGQVSREVCGRLFGFCSARSPGGGRTDGRDRGGRWSARTCRGSRVCEPRPRRR